MGAQAPQRIYTSFCTGAAGLRPLLHRNIVPEFSTTILPVVKKQRQKVQCGEKTTAKFAVRVNPIRESPYVVFLHTTWHGPQNYGIILAPGRCEIYNDYEGFP